MNKKYLLLPIYGCIITACSLFGNNNNNYPTIPLPPQKISESDTAIAVNPNANKSSASRPVASAPMPMARANQRTIQEERSNGTVTQIKVDNGNDLPDYYMYPSQQQNLNTNSTPDKNLSTPSWQISW